MNDHKPQWIPGTPEGVRIFKSIDPNWPKWAVTGKERNTQWFHSKEAAENYARTGRSDGALTSLRH